MLVVILSIAGFLLTLTPVQTFTPYCGLVRSMGDQNFNLRYPLLRSSGVVQNPFIKNSFAAKINLFIKRKETELLLIKDQAKKAQLFLQIHYLFKSN